MPDDSTLEIDGSRIQRLIDVLSLLSLEQYDPALARIEVGEVQDQLSFLEQSLGLFVKELTEAQEDNDEHLAQLEQQKLELEARLEVIDRQRVAIRDLSTPIIELWDEVVTLPIVGLIDTQRSIEMTEQLLQHIADHGCRCVIIDVTGVEVIDTMTTDHFVKMIRAAQMLGAHCVVTGLSPSIAQTIVGIGIDMGDVRTLRSLKDGLAHCLRYLGSSNRRRGPQPGQEND